MDGGFADDILCEMEPSDRDCRLCGFWHPEIFREKTGTSVEKNSLDDVGASDVFSIGTADGNFLAALFYNLALNPFAGKTGTGSRGWRKNPACSANAMALGRKQIAGSVGHWIPVLFSVSRYAIYDMEKENCIMEDRNRKPCCAGGI